MCKILADTAAVLQYLINRCFNIGYAFDIAEVLKDILAAILNNGSYAVHRLGCPSERREISDVQALIDVLRSEFSLQVPEHPVLRATLARLIAAEQ